MSTHKLAGKPAPHELLENIPRLVAAYYEYIPDVSEIAQQVKFGTSGHRGSSLNCSFNEAHILAISQAICEYRKSKSISGPLYMGMDTHALSEPAWMTALEVFAANGVDVMIDAVRGYTPTPVISHAILTHNRDEKIGQADGVVITPSHNPPSDGGLKYNPPTGGPAGTKITKAIQDRANIILAEGLTAVRRIPFVNALKAETTHRYDYITPYITDLRNVIDLEVIATSGLKIGVDPMGGAGIAYWGPIAEMYHLNIEVVNPVVDPTFSFMTLDWDGKIRMDCSSSYAMASLIGWKDHFDIAFGNDTDYDRHGIVTPSVGLMNPNHYLSVAIWYLFQNRPGWRADVAVGKTLVSSSMIDRVVAHLGRKLCEVPVGFKWFVQGLRDGILSFGGEESAGASFLRKDGSVWTTDKDGIILDLLAAEITARTGHDPGKHYQELTQKFGNHFYERIDAPATSEQKTVLKTLSRDKITAQLLAGDPILTILTHAPCNCEPIGGIKVITKNGWFAARPSGTEDIYKIYAESFKNENHLNTIQQDAKDIIDKVFEDADCGETP